ncbi:MAG: hypothetical protein L0226_15345 [Acidobacteria bacterium]|nr:hypothetical protein [Acidobacteriota bacterium]
MFHKRSDINPLDERDPPRKNRKRWHERSDTSKHRHARGRTDDETLHQFFTANIRNPNTRLSYLRAVEQFLSWCENRGGGLQQFEPVIVAA